LSITASPLKIKDIGRDAIMLFPPFASGRPPCQDLIDSGIAKGFIEGKRGCSPPGDPDGSRPPTSERRVPISGERGHPVAPATGLPEFHVLSPSDLPGV